MEIFEYGITEINYLKKCDKQMKNAINRFGMIEREINSDVFKVLINSIVSQQISTKSAKTVFNRLLELSGNEISVMSMHNLTEEQIKMCGMSYIKAGYIRSCIDAGFTGLVNFEKLHLKTDEEIIKELTQIRGVGVWTAQMLLIFSLGRKNVISYNDLAIKNGIIKMYSLQELKKKDFAEFEKRYSPFASVASLYIWEFYMNGEA